MSFTLGCSAQWQLNIGANVSKALNVLVATALCSSFAMAAHPAVAETVAPQSAETPATYKYVAPTKEEEHQNCMKLWEAANHISKKRWREICWETQRAK